MRIVLVEPEIPQNTGSIARLAAATRTPLDLIDDPQLTARGFLAEMNQPEFGRIRFPEGAIATVVGRQLGRAPKLGEHNEEILGSLTDLAHS